jgi:predicted ribosomally synthesized peptide with nif11-like leader
MSEMHLKAYLGALKADAGLQEKMRGAADPQAVVEIAKEIGLVISVEELQKAQAEISDEELEVLAAGYPTRLNRLA